MSLHYLDPRDGEPCPAPECEDGEVCTFEPLIGEKWSDCPACKGTGRRDPDAEPIGRNMPPRAAQPGEA